MRSLAISQLPSMVLKMHCAPVASGATLTCATSASRPAVAGRGMLLCLRMPMSETGWQNVTGSSKATSLFLHLSLLCSAAILQVTIPARRASYARSTSSAAARVSTTRQVACTRLRWLAHARGKPWVREWLASFIGTYRVAHFAQGGIDRDSRGW